MTTPQKIFLEHVHFWILPLLLIVLKVLFDILPKIAFFALLLLAGFGIYSKNKYIEKQEELAAKELENKADLFWDELNQEEKEKELKDKARKEKKEKIQESRIKNQMKQKVPF